ncbi:MAG: TPM domain-containing protein [Candidatus Pacebacteria bacterium]|nr:TPM domain-containing protein [Candidatus Paceibacterota bacterium]
MLKKVFQKQLVFLSVFLSVFLFPVRVAALDFPAPVGYVNDFAGIFSSGFILSQEADLAAFEEQTGIEIAVVTIDSLQETTIEEMAVRLFESWQIGKKEADNGLLFLIAPNQRKLRIEVGYGLESLITDSRAGRIIREEITPEFMKNNYEEGVRKGVDRAKDYLVGGGEPAEIAKAIDEIEDNLPLIVFGFFTLIYFSSFWGRSKRIWPGGVVGLGLGGFLTAIGGTFLYVVFFGLLGLFLDWLLSKNYRKLRSLGKSTGWWSSRGGFGGGGRSGFGGFGGGSSGGGGASGSW